LANRVQIQADTDSKDGRIASNISKKQNSSAHLKAGPTQEALELAHEVEVVRHKLIVGDGYHGFRAGLGEGWRVRDGQAVITGPFFLPVYVTILHSKQFIIFYGIQAPPGAC
jgi:hypothetical protein